MMNMYVELGGTRYVWNNTVYFDLSQPIVHQGGTNAFHLPTPTFAPFRAGSFVGSVEQGGPCRCDVVTLAPHGNGTHTECIGHVAGRKYILTDSLRDMIIPATLVTVELMQQGSDVVVPASAIPTTMIATEALIIRTTFNGSHPLRGQQWSGTNPPYVSTEAMQRVHQLGARHLLIDLPSVDAEEDGGALAAHKIFWQWPKDPRPERTITELIIVPDDAPDGQYLLMFNAAPFEGDAAPSRPVIFPLVTAE